MNELKQTMVGRKELEAVASSILAEAKRQGADQAAVSVGANKGFTVNARGGEVETIEYHQDKGIEIAVMFGKCNGAASISDMRPEAIRDAVAAACHIAKFTDPDPDAGLADKSELAFDYPEIEMNYPWAVTVEKAIELAVQCEQEALACDKRIISAEAASVSTVEAINLYANSHGFMGVFPHTRHDLTCILVAKDKDEMQRDYSYTVACDPKKLKSSSEVAKQAAERTVKRLGARKIATQKAPVIFAAEEARGLLGHFASAITGGALYRKSSFLLDHLGKSIFPSFVQMAEKPFINGALGSSPFDNDGVATRENVFVADGVLQSYALSVYSARKLKLKTTGNAGGMHNLTIQPGKNNLAAMIKNMGTGLLVTEMMGNGVNLVTGDYSRGVGGFWVENGEIQFPVQEITIAGKLQEMYARIADVGNDVDDRGNIRTGSILIEEMMIAGE